MKTRILSLVKPAIGWTLAVAIFSIYASIVTVCLTYLFAEHDLFFKLLPLVWLLLVFPGISISFALARICKRKGLDKNGLLRGMLLLLIALPLIYLAYDSQPIENDYTLADIGLPEDATAETYELLTRYQLDRSTVYWRDIPSVNDLLTTTNALLFSEPIERSWKAIEAGREYVANLDRFEHIIDMDPSQIATIDSPRLNLVSLRTLTHIYCSYARLKTEQGDPEEAVRQLTQLYSVSCKALRHASTLVNKMFWIGMINQDIDVAHSIANHKNCSPNTLALLKEGFVPFSNEGVSLSRTFIAEYLFLKNVCNNHLTGSNAYNSISMNYEIPDSFSRSVFSNIAFPFLFNKNRSGKLLKEYYGESIAGLQLIPPNTSASSEKNDQLWIDVYKDFLSFNLKNIAGKMFVYIAIPSVDKSAKRAWQTKVKSELLAISINKRLGQSVEFIDAYTGEPYLIDPITGESFSAGPDNIAETEDDITLGENHVSTRKPNP